MSNGYNHYIQKYPIGETTFPIEDIESVYHCWYCQFTDYSSDGEIKNIYQEEYAEKSGVRLFIPAPADLTFKSDEYKLRLLFNRKTCQEDYRAFYESFRGVKCEYHDTFRKRYITILMTKKPSIVGEKIYKTTPYQLVEFTFTNVLGESFKTSQI